METDNTRGVPAALERRVDRILGRWDEHVAGLVRVLVEARSAEDFYDAERAVSAAGREVADEIVAAVVEHRATTVAHVERARALAHAQARATGLRLESNGPRPTRVRLMGGKVVSLRTLRLRPEFGPRPGRTRGVGKRGPGGAGVYPALEEIGVVGWSTPALRFSVAREVAEANSVSVAQESLRERGVHLDEKTTLRLTYLVAEQALAARTELLARAAARPATKGEFAGQRIVACLDGGRVRLRVNPTAGRRNKKGHRRYAAPWREPKVLTIYVIDADGERDKRFRPVIDATMGDADEVLRLLIGYLKLVGAGAAAQLTLAGDGAPWIWGRAEGIRTALGLPTDRFETVKDWYHATEKLGEISKIPKWTDEVRKAWLHNVERALHLGRLDAVVAAIRKLAVGRRASAVFQHLPYFDKSRHLLDYPAFRAKKIPSGSGAVESAVRRVVNLRLKGNSIFWLEEHAEAMLHLRSHVKSARWDDLVRTVLGRPSAPALQRAA